MRFASAMGGRANEIRNGNHCSQPTDRVPPRRSRWAASAFAVYHLRRTQLRFTFYLTHRVSPLSAFQHSALRPITTYYDPFTLIELFAFDGSNPSPTTTLFLRYGSRF
jgi:hypothetical protein